MSDKVRFVGPFHGTRALNDFIDYLMAREDVERFEMNGNLEQAYVFFVGGGFKLLTYEMIEDFYV